MKSGRLFVCFMFLFTSLFWVREAEAISPEKASLVLYGAQYTDTDLLHILFYRVFDYRESYMVTGGLSYPLETSIRDITFETESHVAKHTGAMRQDRKSVV